MKIKFINLNFSHRKKMLPSLKCIVFLNRGCKHAQPSSEFSKKFEDIDKTYRKVVHIDGEKK